MTRQRFLWAISICMILAYPCFHIWDHVSGSAPEIKKNEYPILSNQGQSFMKGIEIYKHVEAGELTYYAKEGTNHSFLDNSPLYLEWFEKHSEKHDTFASLLARLDVLKPNVVIDISRDINLPDPTEGRGFVKFNAEEIKQIRKLNNHHSNAVN